MERKLILLAVVLAVASVGLVGCSGGDAAPPAKEVDGKQLDQEREAAARTEGGPSVDIGGPGAAGGGR